MRSWPSARPRERWIAKALSAQESKSKFVISVDREAKTDGQPSADTKIEVSVLASVGQDGGCAERSSNRQRSQSAEINRVHGSG
jgi:hypothetical protein